MAKEIDCFFLLFCFYLHFCLEDYRIVFDILLVLLLPKDIPSAFPPYWLSADHQ